MSDYTAMQQEIHRLHRVCRATRQQYETLVLALAQVNFQIVIGGYVVESYNGSVTVYEITNHATMSVFETPELGKALDWIEEQV